jgi:hypothetical protein
MAPRAYWKDIMFRRPWSENELSDVRRGLRIGVSIEIIADFIGRDVEEVRQKGHELGLLPKNKGRPVEAFD